MSDETGYAERYREASRDHFVVAHCQDCDLTFWHPRKHCPSCTSTRVEYQEPRWPATVYTYTVNRRPKDSDAPPTVLGYIETDSGLRILVNLDVDPSADLIGTPVRPERRESEQGSRIVFVAADPE